MRFADAYLLVLVGLVPLLILLKARFIRDSSAASFSSLGLLAGQRQTWRLRYRWLPAAARIVAFVLLIVALARPQVGQADSETAGEGIDIVLILDTSSSMAAPLGEDTRLVVAQRVLKDFISGRANDRIGLVIFRADSLVLSPMTLDYQALKRLIDDVEDISFSDGTAIGLGLSDGLNLLRESRARSRVAVLLTDGQNNAGTIEPLAASRIAETLGIRVYTIGVLEPPARGSASANVDERALREMASVTGGRYFPAESEEALVSIYESIEELEKSRIGRPQFGAYDEIAIYFLAAALLFLAFDLGLRTTALRQAT
jgi:Ca-activated chloride channel family protein